MSSKALAAGPKQLPRAVPTNTIFFLMSPIMYQRPICFLLTVFAALAVYHSSLKTVTNYRMSTHTAPDLEPSSFAGPYCGYEPSDYHNAGMWSCCRTTFRPFGRRFWLLPPGFGTGFMRAPWPRSSHPTSSANFSSTMRTTASLVACEQGLNGTRQALSPCQQVNAAEVNLLSSHRGIRRRLEIVD